MAESAFLSAVSSYLSAAGLSPVPALIGIAEPDRVQDLPAVVLSLLETKRAGNGLGERSALITDGALEVTSTIDLANPVLPDNPPFVLLDATRRILTLPHGGLVKQDASFGPLEPQDISVTVAGAARTLVPANPNASQYEVDPMVGRLTFGAALPATNNVVATYFLGTWEQRLERIAGTLKVDVCAGAATQVGTLASGVVDAMLDPRARTGIPRLLAISLATLSSIGRTEQGAPPLRRRTLLFDFSFENEINRVESSGGIIQVIPVTTRISAASVNKSTGQVTTTIINVN